jgi:hypothetical protein
VDINGEESPIPAMKAKQIKDFFRQKAKEQKLSTEKINLLKSVLEPPTS